MTPSNANTSGLELVDLNGLLYQAWERLHRSDADVPGALVVLNALHVALEAPLVTVASAQTRISDLEASLDENDNAFRVWAARATAAEARADRLAEIASKLDAAISWLDYPFIDNRTPEAELRQRVGFMMKDAEPHRAALQQETQP